MFKYWIKPEIIPAVCIHAGVVQFSAHFKLQGARLCAPTPHPRAQKITPLHPKNCWLQNESLSGAKDLAFNKGQDCRKLAVEQGFCWFLGRLRLTYEVARQSGQSGSTLLWCVEAGDRGLVPRLR